MEPKKANKKLSGSPDYKPYQENLNKISRGGRIGEDLFNII